MGKWARMRAGNVGQSGRPYVGAVCKMIKKKKKSLFPYTTFCSWHSLKSAGQKRIYEVILFIFCFHPFLMPISLFEYFACWTRINFYEWLSFKYIFPCSILVLHYVHQPLTLSVYCVLLSGWWIFFQSLFTENSCLLMAKTQLKHPIFTLLSSLLWSPLNPEKNVSS